MKIKRYFATDMRQALRMVREEQGPDAAILSSRRVEGGIEIVAAVDYDQDLVAEMMQGEITRDGAQQERDVVTGEALLPEAGPAAAVKEKRDILWAQDPAIIEMRRELLGMRGLLEDQIGHLSWLNLERCDPVKAQMFKRLDRIGIARDVSEKILENIQNLSDVDRAWRATLYGLAQRIPVCEEEIVDHGGVVALVGPTGVGKTTTIAKLAARFALRHGRQHLAMITSDTCRVGAHKQLTTFGQILGVPVALAQSGEELAAQLREYSAKRLVLIDTAGMSQRDTRFAAQCETLKVAPRLKTYLVLSANVQMKALDAVVRRFARVSLSGCVLTKIDEAVSLGDALSTIVRHGLPLAYLSDGQRVPEDIAPVRSTRLVSRAVALAGAEGLLQDEESMVPPQAVRQDRVTVHANRVS